MDARIGVTAGTGNASLIMLFSTLDEGGNDPRAAGSGQRAFGWMRWRGGQLSSLAWRDMAHVQIKTQQMESASLFRIIYSIFSGIIYQCLSLVFLSSYSG